MKTIRRSVFETNSSSTHSISIVSKDNYQNLKQNVIVAEFGEFGWGYDNLNTVYEKLSYVLTMIQYKVHECDDLNKIKESMYYKWLYEMIQQYTGATLEINETGDEYYNMGYIDHQSTDILDEYWSDIEEEFKSNMKEIIFNDKYSIKIDNDNH